VALAGGSLLAAALDALPSPGWFTAAALTAAALLAAAWWRKPWARTGVLPGLLLLSACWSLWVFQGRLDDRLPAAGSGERILASGRIASIPQQNDDYVSFLFEPLPPGGSVVLGQRLPRRLLLRWYRDWPPLAAGQRWRFELTLKPAWGSVNFQGPDRERWLFASGIGGQATVRDGRLLAAPGVMEQSLLRAREAIATSIARRVRDERGRGVIQALAVADRSGIGREDRQILALTGTSHLLAISGLHIGLAAAGGVLMVRMLTAVLPLAAPGGILHYLAITCGLLAALAYSALAAFGVPALRSLLMLGCGVLAITRARAHRAGRAWLLALAAVLVLEPCAPLGAGFWFSFLAVATLLFAFVPRKGTMGRWQTLLRAQAAVMLSLLPVSALWLGGFSPGGYIANLVAIPVVSLAVVPLVLCGIAVLTLSEGLAGFLWSAAAEAAVLLLGFLGWIAGLHGELLRLNPPGLLQGMLALLGALLLLLPTGLAGRASGLFLLLPLLLPVSAAPPPGEVEVEVLDAGQGTALLVRWADHLLLYDTGPGDGGEGNLVASVIVPALRRTGRTPDHIVVSHGDLDHAGGLGTLQRLYPQARRQANLRKHRPQWAQCSDSTDRGDKRYRVLHPTAALPYLGNDSSCVISIDDAPAAILLPGDISAAVERRLVAAGLQHHDILLVPHHGSETSSSGEFLAAVRPRVAVVTAGRGNRFGFPRPAVEERYLAFGSAFWSTGACGALRMRLSADGRIEAAGARRARPALWRWPAEPGCP
jgi:competence protein ComEC